MENTETTTQVEEWVTLQLEPVFSDASNGRLAISGENASVSDDKSSALLARVTLNRPKLHNAFNASMIRSLRNIFSDLSKNPAVRVILLSGEGSSFCAGGDLNWMRQMINYSFEENIEDAKVLAVMLKTIQDCPKPVIVLAHGAVFGGGIGLIAACDIALAVESTNFCLSEVKLGLIPAVISPFVIRKIGLSAAHRYFLTAERFQAEEALRIGLITEVVRDEADLHEKAMALVAQLASNGPEAVSHCKMLLAQVCHFDWNRAVNITTKMIAERRISDEGQEGMKAFLEKRLPHWMEMPE